jgi:site-specific recombinase XerD
VAADNPPRHWLPLLKKTAYRANLNCGHCKPCKEKNECEHWFLHRFRATYITKMLRAGLDLATVMKLSGHSDLKSVQRYIEPGKGKVVQETVNAAFVGV